MTEASAVKKKLTQTSALAVRLAEALRFAGLRPRVVAERTGLSESYLSRLLNGKRKTLSAVAAAAIAAATGVSSDWLLSGGGEMAPAAARVVPMMVRYFTGSVVILQRMVAAGDEDALRTIFEVARRLRGNYWNEATDRASILRDEADLYPEFRNALERVELL